MYLKPEVQLVLSSSALFLSLGVFFSNALPHLCQSLDRNVVFFMLKTPHYFSLCRDLLKDFNVHLFISTRAAF